jgi:hypothetical protein
LDPEIEVVCCIDNMNNEQWTVDAKTARNANGAGEGVVNESNEHFFLHTQILVRDTIDVT